ncbi:MAG: hypothetical protein HQK58_01955 [Deltaproteobacteria bacterium]|nr:hypothetical protein [Deltaproteobacteria bacterium]
MPEAILTDEQYRDLTRRLVISIAKNYRIVPLNSLKHPKYYLKGPVYVALEVVENQVMASLDELEAFSYADTEVEALDQLREEIVSLYEDLQSDRENLGPAPLRWLQYLEEII